MHYTFKCFVCGQTHITIATIWLCKKLSPLQCFPASVTLPDHPTAQVGAAESLTSQPTLASGPLSRALPSLRSLGSLRSHGGSDDHLIRELDQVLAPYSGPPQSAVRVCVCLRLEGQLMKGSCTCGSLTRSGGRTGAALCAPLRHLYGLTR